MLFRHGCQVAHSVLVSNSTLRIYVKIYIIILILVIVSEEMSRCHPVWLLCQIKNFICITISSWINDHPFGWDRTLTRCAKFSLGTRPKLMLLGEFDF